MSLTLEEQFKVVLSARLGRQCVVCNYATDFNKLWAEDDAESILEFIEGADGSTLKAIIVVWGGMPNDQSEGGECLSLHLTPLDWALAFSIRVLRDTKLKERSNFSIDIVDLTGLAFQDAWAVRMRHQLCADMPWMQLHAPLIPRNSEGEAAVFRMGYQPIVGDTAADRTLPSGTPLLVNRDGKWSLQEGRKTLRGGFRQGLQCIRALEYLARQWAASLTQSNDHHDVNNVIGPDILAKPSQRRKSLPGAFLTRLAWIGHDLDSAANWHFWDVYQFGKQLFERPLSVFVIDDQIQQGWGRFVCRLLSGETFDEMCVLSDSGFAKLNTGNHVDQVVKVFGCPGSRPLIDFLETAAFDLRDYSRQIGGLYKNKPSPELIFLDLRLYKATQDARGQAKRLLKVARERLNGGLAWQGIGREELHRISDWCEGTHEDARVADEASLLLPRLLALALPLTPMILFSSTSRTWVRERLKPYRNIFTSFEKPRVLSDPASVEASLTALREALDGAVWMMRLRLQLAHAQAAANVAEDQRPQSRLGNNHIEIYADETNTLEKGITSGLAVCVFPDRNHAESLQAKLLAEHSNAGISWTRLPGGGDPTLWKGSALKRTPDLCEPQTDLLADLLTQEDVQLGPDKRELWSVVATKVPGAFPVIDRISLAAFPDGPLDKALRFNLEFVLFALIPYFAGDRTAKFVGTIDVHLPTRLVPYPEASSEFADKLCRAFDLGSGRLSEDCQSWLIPTSSLSRDQSLSTGFPLVRGWLHEWGDAGAVSPNNITKIRMASLNRGTSRGINAAEASSRRLFHDIADWACSASETYCENGRMVLRDELKDSGLFLHWFTSTDVDDQNSDRSYFETDTRNSFVLMNALKTSLLGVFGESRRNDSIRLLLRNSYVETCDDRLVASESCVQQRLILWMLRNEMDHARGMDLHLLLAEAEFPPVR